MPEDQLLQIKQLRAEAGEEPPPMQKGRAEITRALLVADGGKMLAKDARKRMPIKKSHFAEVLSVRDFIDTKPYHLDRRQTVIILKSELVPRDQGSFLAALFMDCFQGKIWRKFVEFHICLCLRKRKKREEYTTNRPYGEIREKWLVVRPN